MHRRHIPDTVSRQIDKFEQAVKDQTERFARTEQAITNARERLTGGFQRDQEYRDMRMTLDRLLAEQKQVEDELENERYVLTECKHWLRALPDDVTLQPVPMPAGNGGTLAAVEQRIEKAEQEIAELAAVPVPTPDIERRVAEYVASLARPKLRGIGGDEPLQVTWAKDVIAVLALLLPEQMTGALMKEIDRLANSPMPLQARQRRLAELKAEIEGLQRQSLAFGANARTVPPEIVLGVKVVHQPKQRTMRGERQQRIERRQRVTSEEVDA